MRCRQARRLMHEALDGGGSEPSALTGHLGTCAACREHYARLRTAQDVALAAVAAPVPDQRLAEAVERARARAEVLASIVPSRRPAVAWAGAALAFGLATFALGAWFGRTTWPREVTTVRTEVRPEIIERVVEKRVEVPVEVPVVEVRERVVTRTVHVAAAGQLPLRRGGGRAAPTGPKVAPPDAREQQVIAGFRWPELRPPVVSLEVFPATIVPPAPPPDSPPDDPGKTGLLDPNSSRGLAVACSSATPCPAAN